MKKAVVAIFVLLVLILVHQGLPLRYYSKLRTWQADRGSEEVLVGVAWPFETNQDGLAEGLILAQEEINAKGLRGKRIRLLMRDDHLDSRRSRRIAMEFAHNPRIVAAIGYYDDKFTVRASPIFEECGLLHIVVGANNTYMTTHGFRYLIRAVQSSDKIGRALARLCLARGYQTYAIVAEEGAFGEDLAYQTVVELDAQNARVVYQVSYVVGKVDFRAIIDELKAASADVILFLGFEKEAGQFIKSARDLGLDTPIVASSTDTPQLHAIAGEALEGVMFYDDYNEDSSSPENRTFVTRFRRRFGENPQSYAPFGYDALHILAKAIETTGSTDSLSLAYAIRFMDRWEGVTGAYKFDSTGEMEGQDLFLKVYRGGVPVLLDTSHPDPQLSPDVR